MLLLGLPGELLPLENALPSLFDEQQGGGQQWRQRTEVERRTQGSPGTPVQVTVRREGGSVPTLLLTRAY
ncbi:hypothetical protein [Archangium lansingense]|uniref:Uncharacterized protein n=1 Tax=Archangium lansingense TaxID=2995310 RepID=A0ABT4A2K6_9BACT|nr:hypothetical protein [Archangium lansinium]MCY1075833.1 hypothetical protein [Archangium lansinium]